MQIELGSLYKNSSLEMVIPLEKKKTKKKKKPDFKDSKYSVIYKHS